MLDNVMMEGEPLFDKLDIAAIIGGSWLLSGFTNPLIQRILPDSVGFISGEHLLQLISELILMIVPVIVSTVKELDYSEVFRLKRLGVVSKDIVLAILGFGLISLSLVTSAATKYETDVTFQSILFMGAIPSIFEELFFRGWVIFLLQTQTDQKWASLLSALVFTAFHSLRSLNSALQIFLMSFFWALFDSEFDSITTSMASHFIHNTLNIVQLGSHNRVAAFAMWVAGTAIASSGYFHFF